MTANTYECAICLNVNHASKLHCSTCGTVPAQYSISGSNERTDNDDREPSILGHVIPVLLARGYDRAEWHRTSRSYLRTVPVDYYAE